MELKNTEDRSSARWQQIEEVELNDTSYLD